MTRSCCLLSLAPLLFLAQACAGKPRCENILLISLDTTRADYVDTGRGGRAWTPNLRRFAAGSWVFENAYSPIPQTLPAHLSLLSGRLPHELGVFGNEDVYDGRCPLLPEVLSRRGWRTMGIVSLGTLARASGFARGFDHFLDGLHDEKLFYAPAGRVTDAAIEQLERCRQGKFFLFVHYSDPHAPYAAPQVRGRFCICLDDRPLAAFNAYSGSIARLSIALTPGTHRLVFRSEAAARDFDLFIVRRLHVENGTLAELQNLEYSTKYYGGSHLMRAPEASAVIRCRTAARLQIFQVIPILTLAASLENYRREVEYLDGQLGRLLSALASSPVAPRTAVIIFADHGEGLGERAKYIGHVRYLNRQFIHVPLITRFPGETPRRLYEPVGLPAVSSWLLGALGIEDSPLPGGGDRWDELKRGQPGRAPLLAFTFAPAAGADRCSMICWPYQLIVNRDPQSEAITREYYDLRLDCERYSSAVGPELVSRQAPETWRRFEDLRPRWQAAFARRRQRIVSARRRTEALETLGYIRRP
jgi:hypothetical protein